MFRKRFVMIVARYFWGRIVWKSFEPRKSVLNAQNVLAEYQKYLLDRVEALNAQTVSPQRQEKYDR